MLRGTLVGQTDEALSERALDPVDELEDDLGTAVVPAVDRFSRTADARTGGGAGLGLAIVAAVAQSHHGRVACRNRPEEGFEVCMDLAGLDGEGADGG